MGIRKVQQMGTCRWGSCFDSQIKHLKSTFPRTRASSGPVKAKARQDHKYKKMRATMRSIQYLKVAKCRVDVGTEVKEEGFT